VTLFAIGILALSLLAHMSAAGWVRRAFPNVPTAPLYAIAGALSVWGMVSRILVKTYPSETMTKVFALTMIEASVLALAAIPLFLFRAVIALGVGKRRNVVAAVPTDTVSASPQAAETALNVAAVGANEMPSRRLFLERSAGTIAYGTTVGLFGWGMVRGRHGFQIDELVVRVPNLPKALEGYTLAQISDIHVGTFIQARELQEGFELIRQIKPDAMVMTGDLVDHDAAQARVLAEQLRTLSIRDGIYGILGNHDHFSGADEVQDILTRGGVRMLVNEHHVLRTSEGGIALVGLDDLVGRRFGGQGYRLDKAMKGLDPSLPRVVLSHQPSSVEWLWGAPALQLSGHTHGGQIVPGFNPANLVFRYVKGRYQVGDMTLYVNRGFGTAGPPARIGAPPEITKIVLVGG
jgi:uncharacterized protein